MDYLQKLKYHFTTEKGWINDPNGLVYFKGYYHVFYQHAPHFEVPWQEPMHWGHARTRDFLHWEELPVALTPEHEYEDGGCWSGTAIVKDDTLYLFYASVHKRDAESDANVQTVSVAYSTDGIHFEKYNKNPVIDHYPVPDGCPDFRDPAVCEIDGKYYCVMASGNREKKTGNLLLYKSEDLMNWHYQGVMCEWEGCRFCECPSFMKAGDKYLLTASVCPMESTHYFSIMYGSFENEVFIPEHTAQVDKGPDQYAGQAFTDHKGRQILIAWAPGWKYKRWAEKDVGCMSVPRELTLHSDGRITAYPVSEIQPLLKTDDEAIERTDDGFIVRRQRREPLIFQGDIQDLKVLRDGYMLEIFVNKGEEVFTVLL